MNVSRNGSVLVIAIGVALAGLSAQTERPDLTGRSFTFDERSKESKVTGGARLVYRDILITAEEIRHSMADDEVTATGDFVLTRGTQRLVADNGSYNLSTGRIRCRNLRVGQFPFYLSGATVEGTLDELTFTDAVVFFRENAAYTPSLSARRLTYSHGRVIVADGVRLGLLGGRFIGLPRIEQSLDAEFVSYLTANAGYRRNLGASAEFGLNLPVATGVEVGATAAIHSRRGLLAGPAASYRLTSTGGSAVGRLESGYINDSGDRRTDLLGNPIPEERTFVEWRHQQRIGDSVSLNALFNYWQDSEITRDFRPKSFHAVQQPDSFFEASRSGGNSVLSLFTRFHPNRYHRVQQRLPEFRFDLLPTPAPLGLYHRFESSVAFLEEESFLEERRQRTGRFDAYYGLFRPVAPFPWLAVTPVAGGRVTHYTNAAGGRKNHRREIGEVGFDARLLASGTFGYRNELWEIDGLRHLLMPALSYRYAPQASDGQAFIPSIDRRVFATHLQPLSIADSRNIDDLERLDTLRLQFGNTLQTRNDGGGSRDLAAFNIAADYWFTRPRSGNGRKGLSDVFSELSLTPAPWLRLAVFQRTDVHTGIQRELNTSLELIDREWWSVRLATYFLKNDYEEYSLDYQIRLNENWDAAARWRYDSRRNRMNEQTYGLWQRLGQTWTVKYEVSFFEGPRRESSFAFNLEVDLLKF